MNTEKNTEKPMSARRAANRALAEAFRAAGLVPGGLEWAYAKVGGVEPHMVKAVFTPPPPYTRRDLVLRRGRQVCLKAAPNRPIGEVYKEGSAWRTTVSEATYSSRDAAVLAVVACMEERREAEQRKGMADAVASWQEAKDARRAARAERRAARAMKAATAAA